MYKFRNEANNLYYGNAEVDLVGNDAFIKANRNKITFWGIGNDPKNMTHEIKTIKPTKLNDILDRFKVGNKVGLTVGGNKQYFIIQFLEVCISEEEFKSRKLNPYNYVLTVYVYPAEMEDPKDRRFIYIDWDFEDEVDTEAEALKNYFE